MLKKIFLIIMAAVVINSGFLARAAEARVSQPATVIAYYFHGSFRCFTCNAMEKYSKEAIETNFKDALKSGGIEFKEINVEDKGNEHYIKDYGLYTKSLVLSMIKDGKEIKHKNLDKIWEYAKNEKKFIEYVTVEINNFMKEE